MAQFWLDFDRPDNDILREFVAVGSTNTFSVVDDNGTRALYYYPGGGSSFGAQLWRPAGLNVGNCEIYTRMRAINGSMNFPHGVGARIAAGVNGLASMVGGVTLFVTSRVDAGTATNLDVSTHTHVASNANYHHRIVRFHGTEFSHVAWGGEIGDRPAGWFFSTADSTYHEGGIGLIARSRSINRDMWVAALGVGTDGDPAPTGPVDNAAIWLPSMFAGGALAAITGAAVSAGSVQASESADVASIFGAAAARAEIHADESGDAANVQAAAASVGTITAIEAGDAAQTQGAAVAVGAISAVEAADGATLTGRAVASHGIAALEAGDAAIIVGEIPGKTLGSITAQETGDAAQTIGIVPAYGAIVTGEAADGASLIGYVPEPAVGAIHAGEAGDQPAFIGRAPRVGQIAAIDAGDQAIVVGAAIEPATGVVHALERGDDASIVARLAARAAIHASEAGDIAAIARGGVFDPALRRSVFVRVADPVAHLRVTDRHVYVRIP